MVGAWKYIWKVSRGYRLRPWRSPYLRWRLETYFGIPVERLTPQEFCRLMWRERRRMKEFLRWAEETRAAVGTRF